MVQYCGHFLRIRYDTVFEVRQKESSLELSITDKTETLATLRTFSEDMMRFRDLMLTLRTLFDDTFLEDRFLRIIATN